MKNLIALILTAATLFTGSALNAAAQKPQGPNALAAGEIAIGKPAETDAGSSYFTVGANSVRYHTYRMAAGERIRIELTGDGSTDLDMHVYSSNGTLIDSRTGYSDIETSYITAYRSGTITIKVVNRGNVYNAYDLSVF